MYLKGIRSFAIFTLVNLGIVVCSYQTNAEIIPSERRIAWQPGIPGGIPKRTNIFCNVKESIPGSTNVAAGDGMQDDYNALNDAIRLCPPGKVVYLPPGAYKISRMLSFPSKNDFTLRGAGPSRTTILGALTNTQAAILYFAGGEWNPPANRTVSIVSGLTQGSTNIVLGGVPASLSTNVLLTIDQLNDNVLVTSTGAQAVCTFADRLHDGTRNLSQTVKVTGIDNATNVSFWPPLHWTYAKSLNPQATTLINFISNIGLEDFKIINSTGNGNDNIVLNAANQCWVKNIESEKVHSHHLSSYQSLQCEIRDSYFHDAFAYTVGSGYGVDVRVATSMLIENNIFNRLYANLIVSAGSSGCVIGYNFIQETKNSTPTYMASAINGSHSPYPKMNLYEGNVANAFQADYVWGSSGSLTLFRNYFTGDDVGVTSNRKCISFDAWSLSNNVVGNVLGSPNLAWSYSSQTPGFSPSLNVIYRLGFPNIGNNSYDKIMEERIPGQADWDPQATATLIRHGNYDYATKTTVWDGKIPDRNLPASLYLEKKPSWWGTNQWPAIGPDLSPMVSWIPAQKRFFSMAVVTPSSLRISN